MGGWISQVLINNTVKRILDALLDRIVALETENQQMKQRVLDLEINLQDLERMGSTCDRS